MKDIFVLYMEACFDVKRSIKNIVLTNILITIHLKTKWTEIVNIGQQLDENAPNSATSFHFMLHAFVFDYYKRYNHILRK